MLRRAIFAGDMNTLADTIGLLSADMSVDMDIGLGLASR
jgi:hypothetical protein